MKLYKGQTVVTTAKALAVDHPDHSMPIESTPDGTIGCVIAYVPDVWVKIIVADSQGKPVEVELDWSEVKPYYNKLQRALYDSPRCERMVEVSFEPTTVKRGADLVGVIIDAIAPLGGFIAGSYAAWMVAPDYVFVDDSFYNITLPKPKDLDIFCTRKSERNAIIKALRAIGYNTERETEFVVSMSPDYDHYDRGYPKIQVIEPTVLRPSLRHDTPEHIIDSFDFTVCRAVIVDRNSAIVDVKFEEHLAKSELFLMNLHDPIRGSARMRKYEMKGYNANRYTRYLYFEAMRFMVKDQDAEETMVQYGNMLRERDRQGPIGGEEFFDEYD